MLNFFFAEPEPVFQGRNQYKKFKASKIYMI